MPTLEEIQDESVRVPTTEKDDEDGWNDEESEDLSEDDSSDEDDEKVLERGLVVPEETIWERIAALKDIIPPSTRRSLMSKMSRVQTYGSFGLLIGGKIAWVVTTTALLVGLPYALAVEDEMRLSQQERDMMSQQQGAQAMMGPQGAQGQQGQQGSPPQGLRPPGF